MFAVWYTDKKGALTFSLFDELKDAKLFAEAKKDSSPEIAKAPYTAYFEYFDHKNFNTKGK